jgi:hypothetical protein
VIIGEKLDQSDIQKLFRWLRPKLRRLSYQWPARKDAMRKARKARGLYECAYCNMKGNTKLFGPKEISLDHIDPVIDLDGFTTFDEFLTRLFCPESGWQVLCHDCHDEKTMFENEIRKINKNEKKKLDNDEDI